MKRILSSVLIFAMILSVSVSSLISAQASQTEPDVTNLVAEYVSATNALLVSGDSALPQIVVSLLDAEEALAGIEDIEPIDGHFEIAFFNLKDGEYTLSAGGLKGQAPVTVSVYIGTSDAEKAAAQALETARMKAKAEVNRAYAAYEQADYSAGMWAELAAIKDGAIGEGGSIDLAADAEAVSAAKDAALAGMAAVPKEDTELPQAKVLAKEVVETAYASYQEGRYTPDGWEKLTAYRDEAVQEGGTIDQAVTVAQVEAAKEAAIEGMQSVPESGWDIVNFHAEFDIHTLEIAVSGETELGQVYIGIVKKDTEELAKIEGPVAVIDGAFTVKIPSAGLEDGKYTVWAAHDNSGQEGCAWAEVYVGLTEQDKLTLAKEEAAARLQAAFETYAQADYSESKYAELKGIYDAAIEAVNAAGTSEEIAPVVQQAEVDMASVETLKKAALASVNAAFGGYVQTEYSEENYQEINRLYEKAKSDIAHAASAEADGIAKVAIAAMDAVLTLDEEAAQALAAAKEAAVAKLDALFESYQEVETAYTAENFDKIEKIYADAKASVNAAVEIAAMAPIVETAANGMDAVKTIADQAADALAQAKADAQAELGALLDSYVLEAYTAADYAKIEDIYKKALAAVDAAQSVDAVKQSVEHAKAEMDAVPTMAEQELEQARDDASARLDEIWKAYAEGSYLEADYQNIKQIYEAAAAAVQSAAMNELPGILAEAEADMDAVPTRQERQEAELAQAKENAKQEVKAVFESYREDAYSEGNYAVLAGIYEKALSDLDDAADIQDVAAVVAQAKTDFEAVLTISEEPDARFAQFIEYVTNLTEAAYDRVEILENVAYYEGLTEVYKEKVSQGLVDKLYAAKAAVDGSLYTYTQTGTMDTPLGTVAVLALNPHLAKQGEDVIALATYETADGSMVLVALRIDNLELLVGQANGELLLADIYIYDTQASGYLGAFDGSALDFGGSDA